MFNDSPFHAFTPALLERPNPEGAPFQFSSSSLSAALSDPPRHHPLPPSDTPELSQDTLDANLSPLSPLPEIHDVLMSPNDSPYEPQLEVEVSQPYEDSFFFPITDRFQYISPISFPTELSHDNIFQEMWKMRGTEEIEFDSPRSVLDGLVNFADFQDTLSSPLSTPYSTPFFHSNPLSPTSSPNPISFVDLPNAELPSAGSLLFSPTVHPRRPAKKISLRKHKSTMKIPLLTRLSSSLPLSSESVSSFCLSHCISNECSLTVPILNRMPAVVHHAGPIIRTKVQTVSPPLENYKIMPKTSTPKKKALISRIDALWLAAGNLGRYGLVSSVLLAGADKW